MPRKKTHEEYLEELSLRNITSVFPIENYKMANTKIRHKCLKCNYEWLIKPNNVLSKFGCPACSGRAVVQGVNDLWKTDPNVAMLLLNKSEGFKCSRMSGQKLDWVCPECKSVVKQRMISNVVQQGLSCPRCSDGNSIPNKFIVNILDAINIEFETEKIFNWSNNRRYDVYIPKMNCIIEMHGKQHYALGFEYCGGRTLVEEKGNDEYKYNIALANGITSYIIINCEKSELEWIKNEIIGSQINSLLNLSSVNWEECYKKSLHSNIVLASELWNKGCPTSKIMKEFHISNTTACDYLNKAHLIGLCNYLGFEERLKKVTCLNTHETFNSIKDAKNKYHVSHIGDCCKGNRNYAGRHPSTGEKLIWRFVDNELKGADCYAC